MVSNLWTRGHRFAPVGAIDCFREMMIITLTFVGVTKHGADFVAKANQASRGWAIGISVNGSHRATYESRQTGLRAALIEAVDRLA